MLCMLAEAAALVEHKEAAVRRTAIDRIRLVTTRSFCTRLHTRLHACLHLQSLSVSKCLRHISMCDADGQRWDSSEEGW